MTTVHLQCTAGPSRGRSTWHPSTQSPPSGRDRIHLCARRVPPSRPGGHALRQTPFKTAENQGLGGFQCATSCAMGSSFGLGFVDIFFVSPRVQCHVWSLWCMIQSLCRWFVLLVAVAHIEAQKKPPIGTFLSLLPKMQSHVVFGVFLGQGDNVIWFSLVC